jgi:hypothetical protein
VFEPCFLVRTRNQGSNIQVFSRKSSKISLNSEPYYSISLPYYPDEISIGKKYHKGNLMIKSTTLLINLCYSYCLFIIHNKKGYQIIERKIKSCLKDMVVRVITFRQRYKDINSKPKVIELFKDIYSSSDISSMVIICAQLSHFLSNVYGSFASIISSKK